MIGSIINLKCWQLLLFVLFSALMFQSASAESAVVTAEEIQCSYDPDSGQLNPFGSRAFITVTQKGDDTHFRYERFPSLVQVSSVGDTGKVRAVTIENQRTMVFYNTAIEVARGLMRMNIEYYYELIGYKDIAGYSTYDEAMSCG